MLSFKPNQKISDKDYLFGRNKKYQQLDKVLNNVYRGTNCQIQGERRFGKTSILNCAYTVLKKKSDRNYLPIFLDFKQKNSIKGTGNVYRYILSVLIQTLTTENLLDHKILLRNQEILPYLIIEDCYKSLADIEDLRIEGMIEDLIFKYARDYDLNFVFLIDEYEHLLTKSLSDPSGFFFIRNLSDEQLDKCKPLTYVISGSKEWNVLCSKLGSPELNNQGAGIIYVGAIDEISYNEMFDFFHVTGIGDDFPNLNKSEIYSDSGGIPYYAKKIAETIITSNEKSANVLDNEFKSILDNLEDDEWKVITKILKGIKIKDGNLIKNLVDRGILRFDNGFAKVNGNYFENYIKQKLLVEDGKILESSAVQLINEVNTIFDLIEKINLNSKNKNPGDYIFEPIITESSQKKTLHKHCVNENDFAHCINCIYKIVFERTQKNGNKKAKIPHPYNNDPIVHRIDSLRQEYIHLTDSKEYKKRINQISRGELYQFYLKKPTEPQVEDYADFQMSVLSDFKTLLSKILSSYS